jgi:hypothetical protein
VARIEKTKHESRVNAKQVTRADLLGPESPRGPPRDPIAVERSEAIREEIRGHLERHSPLAKPLEAKDLQPLLSHPLGLRRIQMHMASIREQRTS